MHAIHVSNVSKIRQLLGVQYLASFIADTDVRLQQRRTPYTFNHNLLKAHKRRANADKQTEKLSCEITICDYNLTYKI